MDTAMNDGDDDLSAVWASGDSERINRALARLLTVVPPRPEIAAPEPEVLDAFADPVPSDAVRNYIWVVGNYRPIRPELEVGDVVRRWVEAVVRTGDSSAALQVALYLQPEMPEGARVRDALDYVATRGLSTPRERDGAEYLARYFLDVSDTYDRAIEALAPWRGDADLGQILDRLAPYVHAADRPKIGL
jgi:hypothetical protein